MHCSPVSCCHRVRRGFPGILLLLPALLFLPVAGEAALSVPGSTVISQNFNSLTTATGTTWANNSTIPGWWVHRASATNSPSINIADGSGTEWLGGLYSMGLVAGERALGSSPISFHGSYSLVTILRNDSARALQVTNIRYDHEIYRTNSYTVSTENYPFSWRIETTESTITAALVNGTATSGWTEDAGLSRRGYSFTGAGFPAAAGVVNPPVTFTKNQAPSSPIVVPPGRFLALRWEDRNDVYSDSYSGLDNVAVTFTELPCAVLPVVSGRTRNENGTPDDTWSFNVTATGVDTGASPGWSIPSLGVSAAYGTQRLLTFPASLATVSLTVQDQLNPSCSRALNAEMPAELVRYVKANQGQSITFSDGSDGEQSFARRWNSADLSWNAYDGSFFNHALKRQPVPAPANLFHYDVTSAQTVLTTERVNITQVATLTASVDLAAYTTNASAFESGDVTSIRLETSANGTFSDVVVAAQLIPTGTAGDALFPTIRAAGTGINFGTTPGLVPYPATPWTFHTRSATVLKPAGAQWARIVINSTTDSSDEHLLIDNITFRAPVCNILPEVVSVTRTNPAGNEQSPSTDVFTVEFRVSNEDVLRTEYSLSPGGTRTYGTIYTAGPFPATGPAQLAITDTLDPLCSTTLTVEPPSRYVMGIVKGPGSSTPLYSSLTVPPSRRWQNNAAAGTLSQGLDAAADLRNGTNHVRSALTPVPAGSGKVYVSALLEVTDTSTSSGFEDSDFFQAWARYRTAAGPAEFTVSMLMRHDDNQDGKLAGYTDASVATYNANPGLDEFNSRLQPAEGTFTNRFLLFAELPDNAVAAGFEISGECGTALTGTTSESFLVREVEIVRGIPREGSDADHDGQPDIGELYSGTDPFDATTSLRYTLTSIDTPGGEPALTATIPSVDGVFYAVYASIDLVTWLRISAVHQGTGGLLQLNAAVDESLERAFFRIDSRLISAFPPVIP